MSIQSSSDSKNVAITTEEKNTVQTPVTNRAEAVFDIDSQDLPKRYFLRPFFLGTLIASGLSVTAVSWYPQSLQFSTNSYLGRG